jgi:Transcriptional regulators
VDQVRQAETMNAQVLGALRTAVITGELAPGTLHSVQTLATQLGVSRTPVREALIKLAQHGMVRFERNRGVRILQTSLHDLEEVFALRLLLEVPATRRACQLLDAAGRKELRRVYRAMERAVEADDEFKLWEHDRRFHRALLEASGNSRLAEYVAGCGTRCCAAGCPPHGRPGRSATSSPSISTCWSGSRTATPTVRPRRCARTSCTPRSCSSRRRAAARWAASTSTRVDWRHLMRRAEPAAERHAEPGRETRARPAVYQPGERSASDRVTRTRSAA